MGTLLPQIPFLLSPSRPPFLFPPPTTQTSLLGFREVYKQPRPENGQPANLTLPYGNEQLPHIDKTLGPETQLVHPLPHHPPPTDFRPDFRRDLGSDSRDGLTD